MNKMSVHGKKQMKVPELPEELFNDQCRRRIYETQEVPPFLSTTECMVAERYNTDPNFLRATFYVLPVSEYSLGCCGLPLALVATPFSESGTLTVVEGMDRCAYCRTYHSCFTKGVEDAHICNICGTKTRGIVHTDNLGLSTMETTLSAGLTLLRPVCVFVFDFTLPWVREVLGAVESLFDDENFLALYEHVSFVVLNRGISVFTKAAGLSVLRILDTTMPAVGSNVVFSTSDRATVASILRLVSTEETDLRETNTDGLMPLLLDIAAVSSGVKVVWFTSAVHPTLNYEFFLREAPNTTVSILTDIESTQGNAIFSLAFYTSGQSFFYSAPNIPSIASDLRLLCTTRTVFNVNTILKLSDNLAKAGVIAPVLEDNRSHTQLSALTPHSSITFQLALNGHSKNVKYCQIQTRFVDYDGSTKLRVFNHSFTTGSPAQFYFALAADTIFAVLAKLFITEDADPEAALVKALCFYRNKCVASSSPSQFVLPETLKTLPLLVQAIPKSIPFSSKTRPSKAQLISMDVQACLRFFYPSLFALSEYNSFTTTRARPLALSSLSPPDIFILDNGIRIIIYIACGVDNSLIDALFQQSDSPLPIARSSKLPPLELRPPHSEESELIHRAIAEIATHHNRAMPTLVVRAGQPAETDFMGYMVEDAINGRDCHIDYIFQLHVKVQKGQ